MMAKEKEWMTKEDKMQLHNRFMLLIWLIQSLEG